MRLMRPNEKAQVRPRRLRETKRSQANWHGSKASPAAIWFDIVFITQNSRLHYEEPQTRQPSGLGRKSHRRKRRQRRTAGPSFPSWPSVGISSKLGRPRSGRTVLITESEGRITLDLEQGNCFA